MEPDPEYNPLRIDPAAHAPHPVPTPAPTATSTSPHTFRETISWSTSGHDLKADTVTAERAQLASMAGKLQVATASLDEVATTLGQMHTVINEAGDTGSVSGIASRLHTLSGHVDELIGNALYGAVNVFHDDKLPVRLEAQSAQGLGIRGLSLATPEDVDRAKESLESAVDVVAAARDEISEAQDALHAQLTPSTHATTDPQALLQGALGAIGRQPNFAWAAQANSTAVTARQLLD